MEVDYDLSVLFTTSDIAKLTSQWVARVSYRKFPVLADVINQLGRLSAQAQGLRQPVTTYERVCDADQILYILWHHGSSAHRCFVVGFLKISRKPLYLFDAANACYQVSPVCILDFYVHFTRQRQGCGRRLLDHMLSDQAIEPGMVAMDRPSNDLIQFFKKHYDLTDPSYQPNNFVVYPEFFKFYELSRNTNFDKTEEDLWLRPGSSYTSPRRSEPPSPLRAEKSESYVQGSSGFQPDAARRRLQSSLKHQPIW